MIGAGPRLGLGLGHRQTQPSGGFLWTALFRARSEGLGARKSEEGSENESPLPEQTLDVSAVGATELADDEKDVEGSEGYST